MGDRATSAESDCPLVPSQPTSQLEADRQALPWTHVAGRIVAVMVAVVLVDQLTKAGIVDWLGPGQAVHRWELAGPWLAFEYVENTGAAFGILAGRVWLLSALAVLVGFGFLLAFRSDLPRSGPLRLSIGLVIGGGVGNFIDRVRLGYVVDFVAVGVWPKFNVADSAITIGLIVLALNALREEPSRENST